MLKMKGQFLPFGPFFSLICFCVPFFIWKGDLFFSLFLFWGTYNNNRLTRFRFSHGFAMSVQSLDFMLHLYCIYVSVWVEMSLHYREKIMRFFTSACSQFEALHANSWPSKGRIAPVPDMYVLCVYCRQCIDWRK